MNLKRREAKYQSKKNPEDTFFVQVNFTHDDTSEIIWLASSSIVQDFVKEFNRMCHAHRGDD
jgi:hypothetical protein